MASHGGKYCSWSCDGGENAAGESELEGDFFWNESSLVVVIAMSLCRDSWLDQRLIIWRAWELCVPGRKKESSSRGSGSGAVQLCSANETGRPVMTANKRSVEQSAHQTRYLISLEPSDTSPLSFRRLRPRVVACRIATPLTVHDLGPVSSRPFKRAIDRLTCLFD